MSLRPFEDDKHLGRSLFLSDLRRSDPTRSRRRRAHRQRQPAAARSIQTALRQDGRLRPVPRADGDHLPIVDDERSAENISQLALGLRRSLGPMGAVGGQGSDPPHRQRKDFPSCRSKISIFTSPPKPTTTSTTCCATPARTTSSSAPTIGHTDASSEVDAIDIFRANKEVTDPVKAKNLRRQPAPAVRDCNRRSQSFPRFVAKFASACVFLYCCAH